MSSFCMFEMLGNFLYIYIYIYICKENAWRLVALEFYEDTPPVSFRKII